MFKKIVTTPTPDHNGLPRNQKNGELRPTYPALPTLRHAGNHRGTTATDVSGGLKSFLEHTGFLYRVSGPLKKA